MTLQLHPTPHQVVGERLAPPGPANPEMTKHESHRVPIPPTRPGAANPYQGTVALGRSRLQPMQDQDSHRRRRSSFGLKAHAGDRPPIRRADCPVTFYDPWPHEGEPAPSECAHSRLRGTADNLRTGETRNVYTGCDRWSCQSCGPRRLKQHMAHFRDVLSAGDLPLLYSTLTLRPEDSDRLGWEERVDVLRDLFANRFIRRLTNAAGCRPLYLAQVDVESSGRHHHVHAIVETGTHPSVVAGCWIGSGGGLNHDIQILNPPDADQREVANDIARVAGYVVKGSRWPGHGRLMCSREIGYGSAAAVKARAEYRDLAYGGQRAQEVFEPAEVPERPTRTTRPPKKREPFVSAALPSAKLRSPVSLPNGEYELITRYDRAAGRAVVTAIDSVTKKQLIAGHNSPQVLRRLLAKYDASRTEDVQPPH